jgi:CDP-2,3-bis-(O-geranylgeranyl)-sn-glycerol synthase
MNETEPGLALSTLRVLYFFVPAYLANMAPVLVGKRLAFLAVPLDFGASLRGARVFGDHKTWRGLVVGIAGAILGDAVKSFFKRRVGIPPGKPWIGPDEVDFYLGATAVAAFLVPLPLLPLLLSMPVVIAGHFVSNLVAWALGLKDVWI